MPDNQKDSDRLVTRRNLLGAAALGAAAATLGTASSPAEAAADPKVAVHVGGKYEQVPLRKDSLRVTAVQSVIRSVRDTRNPAKEMKANVDHMLDMVDAANGFPGPSPGASGAP